MGAQTSDRLEQFKKRFNEWDADQDIKGVSHSIFSFVICVKKMINISFDRPMT
jgi:hypothetical protein